MDEEINYTLTLTDNISQSLARIEQSQGKLATQMQMTTQHSDSQKISFLTQVEAIRSIDRGFRGLVGVVIETGLVSGKTAKQLQTVVLAIHGVSSAFMLLKGARQVLMMLQSAEIGLASVETYRSVLMSPGKLALVGLALGASAAAVGYYAGSQRGGGSSTTNNNITFSPPGGSQSEREMAKGTLAVIGG